jgi:hypothetical protein
MRVTTVLGDDTFDGESQELRNRQYFHNSQMRDEEPEITNEMILGIQRAKSNPDPAIEQANTQDLKRKGLK